MIGTAELQRSSPETQGIPSESILAFLDAVQRDDRELHSLMLLRRGTVVAEGYWEPYRPASPHMLFSLSKSFTSTAIGLLVAEGRLSVDDSVLGYFPDEAPASPSDNLRAMRVRHLLTMTTGHDTEPTPRSREKEMTWAETFLAHPVEHPPGTHFVYNSAATYMLSAIVQRISGERLIDYLQPRLFAPLGIENPTWETSPEGIDAGGWGLSIKTADIARFGQLYLQGGVWQGTRLLPEAWVKEATSRQVPNGPSENPDWVQGYGYQFWRCRHGAYRGDGAFGQFCLVLPEQEVVIATTAGLRNMQSILDLVWEHLLPALGASALPESPAAHGRLAERLAGLRLAPTVGQSTSPIAGALSGREFAINQNAEGVTSISFDFAADGAMLAIKTGSGEQRIRCGFGTWVRSEGIAIQVRRGFANTKISASGAWVDDRTYVAQLCFDETPFRRTLTCQFGGDRLVVDQTTNVSFGPVELSRLEGLAAS